MSRCTDLSCPVGLFITEDAQRLGVVPTLLKLAETKGEGTVGEADPEEKYLFNVARVGQSRRQNRFAGSSEG